APSGTDVLQSWFPHLLFVAAFNTIGDARQQKAPATSVAEACHFVPAVQRHSDGTSPEMISPNSSHFWPLKRCICNCASGAKSVAEVLILTPGSSVSGVKSFRLVACFMTLARVRSSPHISSTLASVCAAP